MPVETHTLITFLEWCPGAAWTLASVVFSLVIAGVILGWLVAAVRHGPMPALRITGSTLAGGVMDLLRISPRRVGALAWLAVREAIRRKVVVGFVVFALILLLAAWFLDPTTDHPARLYLSFVLTATSYLVLVLALFLSALSLPEDIKNKTIHTVVTKPVRTTEIVLGRMIGFTIVGTVLLVLTGAISYVFVVRGLSHTHELTEAELQWVQGRGARERLAEKGRPASESGRREDTTARRRGFTRTKQGHRHEVVIDAKGNGRVGVRQGHWHKLSVAHSGEKPVYRPGPPRGRLIARVPIYGKLRFKDRNGADAERGVNVGDEWAYRSFIEGQTLAEAIWTFDGITKANFPRERFPEGLPLEMTIEVFRTYKGDTDDPEDIPLIPGSLAVRNPNSGLTSAARIFTAKDFTAQVEKIPRQLETPEGRPLDLFEDLVEDGKLEIVLRCEERGQYFGAAQADVYFRAAEGSFALNFAKGYLGIWLQMILVIGFGVMFSTFLSAPIAVLATCGVLVGGLFKGFVSDLAAGELVGGGPFESLCRLLTGQNVTTEMDPGMLTTVVKMLDWVFEGGLGIAAAILPDFERFGFADFVARGYSISADPVLKAVTTAVVFVLPLFVAGYLFLKMREVAK